MLYNVKIVTYYLKNSEGCDKVEIMQLIMGKDGRGKKK